MKKLLITAILIVFTLTSKSQDHSKVFLGFGYNHVFSQELSTGIVLKYGTSYLVEARLKGSSSGVYIDWVKFYITEKLAIDLTSNLAFFKHAILNAANLHYEASARLYTTSLILRYNFVNRTTQNKSTFNTYVGIGPAITKFKNLSSKIDENFGPTVSTEVTYSNYVLGMAPKLGIEYITQPQNWDRNWILLSFDLRSCIAFSKQTIEDVKQIQNEFRAPSILSKGRQVNPSSVAICFGVCFGF